ncbi:MAG TPA: C4-type zinc ribbon domain-containing protein [Nitrospiria bacterium]
MVENLDRLVQLQEIDTRLGSVNRRIAKIPEQLTAGQASVDEAKIRLAAIKADTEARRTTRREKERELEAREAQLSKARGRQSEIKTNKEFQTHLHEIETLESEKGRVEEDLLILMDEIEKRVKEETGEGRIAEEAVRAFDSLRIQLEEQGRALGTEREGLEKERSEIASAVKPDLLATYQNLIRARGGLAVVPIVNGTCGGCHMSIPPQRVAEVRGSSLILACSECQRILYWRITPQQAVTESGAPSTPAVSF